MIPIIHARIHKIIEKHAEEEIVDYAFLKEWVGRMIRKGGWIPKDDIPETIDDLCKMGLLTKVCRLKYRILRNTERPVREPLI